MSSDFYEKAEKLLDIIHSLAISRKNTELDGFPFMDDEGGVLIHPALKAELDKGENADLRDWAAENIKELF